MNRIAATVGWLLLSCLATFGFAQTSQSPEVVPDAGTPSINNSFSITGLDTSLGQIELSPDLILSAGRGASFNISYPDDAGVVTISLFVGPVAVFDIKRNRLIELKPGQNSLSLTEGLPPVGSESGSALATRDAVLRSPYRLSDWIMARQQQYLGSLKIELRDLNKGLASIIRSLVGH